MLPACARTLRLRPRGVFNQASFTPSRPATETPFNLILEARKWGTVQRRTPPMLGRDPRLDVNSLAAKPER
jgi:hypothetical protein